jgi:hypothetical protein
MSTNEMNKIDCPVCGKTQVGEYDICPVCRWENDPIQLEHSELGGGANYMALKEARKAYQQGASVR